MILCVRCIHLSDQRKLEFHSQKFYQSLLHTFQVYQTLQKSSKLEMGEVRSVCADLVFVLFICPAICDPEPHGITTDIPISHIARHNLMQMAQIIQVLAISQWEEIDSKVQDLYGKFEKVMYVYIESNLS